MTLLSKALAEILTKLGKFREWMCELTPPENPQPTELQKRPLVNLSRALV